MMPQLRFAQLRFLSIILLCWLSVFFVTRSILLLIHSREMEIGLTVGLKIYAVGFFCDLGFLIYALLPMAACLLLGPRRIFRQAWHQSFLYAVMVCSLFVMLFSAVAEYLFWDEFGVRFNFIAVDYLVYSKEVINNIRESYPIPLLLSLLLLISLGITFLLRESLRVAFQAPLLGWKHSMLVIGGWILLACVCMLLPGQDFPADFGGNAYQRELANNGPYQFFAAFRNNELDYQTFYASLPYEQTSHLLRNEVEEPGSRFIGNEHEEIRRAIYNPGETRHPNVILVTIESLSAKYLGSFGDVRGLTPNLDKLRSKSLAFTHFYATGTRTDRGLEAITLSIPPTPGRSIVKRVGRESGYASLGQQLRAQGYDSVFLYGGRGYFDNMNAFFSGNGYRIVDQSSVPESEIHFKNAWGMSDEDLYTQAVKVADSDHAANRPFFLQLMTTSNHRPFTYPDGRIDILSGTNREGAVKYTDYAIGQFLAQAKTKPWFDQTLFIFVADHTAGSAGKEDLPITNYHIPLFIYAPDLIEPREYSSVASQIDLAPTLLGLLNMNYTSTFFGRNVLRKDAQPGRALIGNYQHLGLFDGESLAILSPRHVIRRHDNALGASHENVANVNDPLVQRAIAYYQNASYNFKNGLLAWRHKRNEAMLSRR